MAKILVLIGLIFFSLNVIFSQESKATIEGELKKWHKVTLSFEGENLSEADEENPFLNYRLNVFFKNKNKTMVVPGFFAADGNAAETSAHTGNVWKVRFMPDEVGEWNYEVSFRKGLNIAVSDDIHEGEAVGFNGEKGSFNITEADTEGSDFRTKGRLKYNGTRYLRFADTNDPFLKGGTDSPENFLAFYEFDQTPAKHKYEPHAKDWNIGDPTWQDGKGKNIIGALNYLASKGMNSVYFLTMNIQGDGKDVWPWTNMHERYRFDCSKLDQWEVIFDHMDDLGLMLHIVTQETENELLLDIGETKTQRKLYYRELIARFSHHLAVTWNLGEENGPLGWTPKGQSDKDRKAMSKYLKTRDPYQNFVALHTHAHAHAQDLFLTPLLGYEYIDGPSLQVHNQHEVHELNAKWITESANFGKQWVVNQDEIGPANFGVKPDSVDPDHDDMRANVLWGSLMAGAAGVEWYFGYKLPHTDLNCEDWRSRDILWDQTRHALDFFNNYLPSERMVSNDDLTANDHDYVFANAGEVYAIYFPNFENTKLDLTGINNTFSVDWYNPKNGGALQSSSVKHIEGGAVVSIGNPPSLEGDWVALIRNESSTQLIAKSNIISLKALENFEIDKASTATYYKEKNRGSFAINATKKEQRDELASAFTVFNGTTGYYSAVLNTIAENDGESTYEIEVNREAFKTVKNPQVPESFKNVSLD